MLIKLLSQMVLLFLNTFFGGFAFPELPDAFMNSYYFFIDALESAMGFVWLIVPRDLVVVMLPIILLVMNFDMAYGCVMWILRKIPFLGIK